MRHPRLNTDGKTLESHRNDEHNTGVGPAASRCLSEDEVIRLCAGEISETHLGRIDEHLDRCEACQRWVAEVMAHGATSPAGDDASTYPTAFRAGTMAAGRFRIVRFIKRGGMGEVYEAFDSVLETRVALKTIISTACDSPRAVRKMKAEVQLARSIRHPNVCSVFDIWEHHPGGPGDASSVYFFTMEFIDGMSLRQMLERSLLELGETLRVARLQLLGLRAAHDTGVVHRDFKSDNVMLRSDRNDDSQVVVMDFGLARTLQKEAGASNDSEQFAGSVAYMAPEQVEGKRHIGPEADVFAFGVVLFEMLTGELPWMGDSPWTTAALRLSQRAPAPSRHRPGLAPRLDAFVLKCLSREPADRFRDAREALTAFDAMLGQPPRRTRPWLWAAAVAVVLAAVVVGVQQRTASRVSALQPGTRSEDSTTSTPAASASPASPTPATAPAATAAGATAAGATAPAEVTPSAPAGDTPVATATADELVAAAGQDPAPIPAAPGALGAEPSIASDPAARRAASAAPARSREARDTPADDAADDERASTPGPSRAARREPAEADPPERERATSDPADLPSSPEAPPRAVLADPEPAAPDPDEDSRVVPARKVPSRPAQRAPGAPAKLRSFE